MHGFIQRMRHIKQLSYSKIVVLILQLTATVSFLLNLYSLNQYILMQWHCQTLPDNANKWRRLTKIKTTIAIVH